MIHFFNSFAERYRKLPNKDVADSGYGPKENYRFMEESGITAYVKYNWGHREQRMHYEPNPSVRNFYMPKVTIMSGRCGNT